MVEALLPAHVQKRNHWKIRFNPFIKKNCSENHFQHAQTFPCIEQEKILLRLSSGLLRWVFISSGLRLSLFLVIGAFASSVSWAATPSSALAWATHVLTLEAIGPFPTAQRLGPVANICFSRLHIENTPKRPNLKILKPFK